MTQTPLQEAIQKLESLKSEISNSLISKDQKAWALSVNESAIQHIKLLLPKEKEFVNRIWNAGATSGYDNKRVYGTCEWDKEGHAANLIDFINELYPKS